HNDSHVTMLALEGGDKAEVSYTYLNELGEEEIFLGKKNAGVYEITATITIIGGASSNYVAWGPETATLTINPKKVMAEWQTQTFTYNGQDQSAGVRATFTKVGNEIQTLNIAFEGTSGMANGQTEFKNAGTYTATASYTADNNYEVQDTVRTITINKHTLRLFFLGDENGITYDSKTYYLLVNTINAKNLSNTPVSTITVVTGDEVEIDYAYAKNGVPQAVAGAKNVGVYTITATLKNETESNFENWSSEATLTISKKILEVQYDTLTKVYDATTNCTGITGILGICDVDKEFLTYSATYADKNVSNNNPIDVRLVTKEGAEAQSELVDNYYISFSKPGSITAKELRVDENQYVWTKIYNGTINTAYGEINAFATGYEKIPGDDIVIIATYNSKNVKEANRIIFSRSGTSANNYFMSDLEFPEVDFETTYLISPLDAGILWSNLSFTYNGENRINEVSAYVELKTGDLGLSQKGDGRAYLTITTYARNAEGELVPVEFRNAGTYIAMATSQDFNANMQANYGITSSTNELVISPLTIRVIWYGINSVVYVYNGEDQSGLISVEATLVDSDMAKYSDYLEPVFGPDGFKNAGDYTFTVRFKEEEKYKELANNYILADATATKRMEKAEIGDGLFFSGEHTWQYYDGEKKGYFVANQEPENGTYNTYFDLRYKYDDVPIIVHYKDGEGYDWVSEDGSITVIGNAIKNAGKYTLRAVVDETDNYKGWESEIDITVNKGVIDNLFMTDRGVDYDGYEHRLYVSNVEGKECAEKEAIQLPDKTNAIIEYSVVSNYVTIEGAYLLDWGAENNYAVQAGTHVVNAQIENLQNYEYWHDEAILVISQAQASVIWRYNIVDEIADFKYNAQDQTSAVTAYILREGPVTDANRTIPLKITFALDDGVVDYENIEEELRSHFAVAGGYKVTASFNQDEEETKWHDNNYILVNQVNSLEMKKYEIKLHWLYGCSCYPAGTEYTSGCVYDGNEHSVVAKGIGIDEAEMALITSEEGFEAINAGLYVATVNGIAEGYDQVQIGEETYQLAFVMNYKLPSDTAFNWSIEQRPITLVMESDTYLSKIYDGTQTFNGDGSGAEVNVSSGDNNTIVKTKVYYFKEENYDDKRNKVVYSLSNIINGDADEVDIVLDKVFAERSDVKAHSVTIDLGELSSTGNYRMVNDFTGFRYYKQEECQIIQQLKVKASFVEGLSHVYNTQTFSKVIADGSFKVDDVGIINLVNVRTGGGMSELYSGNFFEGNFNIGGATSVGKYAMQYTFDIVAIDGEGNKIYNYAFTDENKNIIVRDENGNVTNNVLSVMFEDENPIDYVINERRLRIEYHNQLQSFNAP
ncbi:MAG: hypothetical protein IKB56_05165, partial [Clostridia bacterium]|nr:hypothetical protein [Clostridia bacterium]